MEKTKTEAELLKILIAADFKTVTSFAKRINMTRQNINVILRKAEKEAGKLPENFKIKLEHNKIDLHKWQPKPTNDYVQDFKLPTAAEAEFAYGKGGTINSLVEKLMILTQDLTKCQEHNKVLKMQLDDCNSKLTQKNHRRSA